METASLRQVESNLWFQNRILEQMQEGICLSRRSDGGIVYTSPVFDQMFGYGRGELIGKSIASTTAFNEDELNALLAQIGESLQEQGHWKGEIRSVRKDGTRFWCGAYISAFDEAELGTVWLAICEDITERKVAEDDRDRFFNLSLDLLCYIGFDGYFKRVNPAFEKTLGFSTMDLLQSPFIDYVHPDHQAPTLEELAALQMGEVTVYFEVRYRRLDGSYVWLVWSAYPLLESGMIFAVAHDITERKIAEENLKHSQMQLAEAMHIARIGSWEWDIRTNKLIWSDELQHIFGIYPAQRVVTYKEYLDRVLPEDRAYANDIVREAVQKRTSFDFYHRTRLPNGTIGTIRGRGQVITDENNKPIKMIGTAQDVTREKQAEADLAGQHHLLHTLIDTLPDFIYVKDTRGRFIISNIAHAQRLGTTPEQIVGKWDFDFYPAEIAERFYEDEQIILRTGQPILRRESMGVEDDGTPTWLMMTKAPLRDQNGNIVGVVGINHDITASKMVQQEIELARKRAEEANHLKSHFLTTISHELRTPLNAIIGFSDILLKGILGPVSENQREYVRDILSNGEHLLAIINDLLDISKIESGQFELETMPINLSKVIAHIRSRLQGLAEAKGLVFITDLDPALPTSVMGDDLRLEQILTNLIGNAIKFTDKGQVKVTIEKLTGDIWQIAVSDTGIGIPPEAMSYLFDEFRQVDNSLERPYEGTGLGLAIVNKLVKLMGGTVGVSSTVGKGSTFTVQLPLIQQ